MTGQAAAPAGTSPQGSVAVSATLAASEMLARARAAGQPVLPMSFGEAGLPVHPLLTAALARAAGSNSYSPVAGLPALREAAAGYWARRGLPTAAGAVIAGPGSKPLLFGLLAAIGADVAIPRPSWVSYAPQAVIAGARAHRVPAARGEGGVCDPGELARVAARAAAAGRRIGAVVATLPDNPTGRIAAPGTVRALAEVARAHDLVIISDEIYRELVFDPAGPFCSPAQAAPERTVITTGLSKNLALGGWRLGVARLPDGPLGEALAGRLLGIASEIWSAAPSPVQDAAALAFTEPPPLAERIADSRRLHATVCRAVAARFAAAGASVPAPQGAFYVYPDFTPWRAHLAARHRVTTGPGLARLLLDGYQLAVLPGSAFGEPERALRLRVATSLLYGESDRQREAALHSTDPEKLPWIAAALSRLEQILADLAP